jgi:hypothetical protein
MYKTSIECYQKSIGNPIEYSMYNGPVSYKPIIEKEEHILENFDEKEHKKVLMKWKTSNYTNMSDPNVWGSAFWFILHNGSSKYPISPSSLTINRMKGFIKGIPLMLPCAKCQYHAICHIEINKDNLDDICSSRETLFAFFVDFHNIVNKRYNKPTVSVEDAYKMYSGGVGISTLSYE